MNRIPNVNTLADLIDRLIVEVNKLATFENRKREESGKDSPEPLLIAKWDMLSRDCCELRSALKTEINLLLMEIVESGTYTVMKEPRTFRPSPTKIADVLVAMCEEGARSTHNTDLVRAIEEELCVKS